MTTGDLKNNLRKLQSELRAVKYSVDVDFESLGNGATSAFLPIYHYIFVDYSRSVAEKIATMQIELCGKTDLRFVEAMYKVLREMFAYKPPVTKEQFFAPGFGERKVIMCAQVLQLVHNKHRSLAGVSRSASHRHRPNQTLPAAFSASSENTPRIQHDDCAVLCEKHTDAIAHTRVVNETQRPMVIREVTSVVSPASRPVTDGESETDQSLTSDSYSALAKPVSPNVGGAAMLQAVNRIADAVHMLSVRVDSVDRRLIQLESVERRMNELSLSDMTQQLADIGHLQQRITHLEQTLLTTDKAAAVDEHRANVVDGTDTADVVQSATTNNVDALVKQINNLTARMTLAENQLMLQSSKRRSIFPAPTSGSVEFPSITDDIATNGNDSFDPTKYSNNSD